MAKIKMIGAICLCWLTVTMPALGLAADRKTTYKSAVAMTRSEIWQAINSGKCGSASVAITLDGKVAYAEGFGMADREKSRPVTHATLLNIGSVSKVYVATAIMLLVDDGKVALDRPVTDYLPEFRMADERYKAITVRMLLNHTSGLPGTEGANSFGFRYDPGINQTTLQTLSRAYLKHAPGAMAVYCNDGFTLAELVVERVSKQRYIDFLNKRIFKPLGLKNTGIGIGDITGKPVAFYYDPKTGKKHPPESLSVLGAGGLSATAVDVCRFADAFSSVGRLLSKASLAEMKKAQPSTFKGEFKNPDISLGLGWDMTGLPRYDAAGLQVLGKSGGTGNYSSMVYTVPDKRISVAVIAAGRESGAMKLALDILDAVLVEKKLIPPQKKALPIPPQPQALPRDYASFSGYYAGAGLGQAVFDAEKKTVTLFSFKGQEKMPIATMIYNNGYYLDATGGRSYFASIGTERYFVNNPAMLGIDVIAMQKVKPVENPKSLKINVDGKLWLRRNVSPAEGIMALDSHFVMSFLYKDLPGYVDFIGIKRIESPVFAGMPFDAIRDQSELTLFEKGGATWAWVSSLLFSPAAGTAPLKAGENVMKIGGNGYSEWRIAGENLVLSVSKPAQGRIIVFSADDTVIYDSAVDTGDIYAAKGSYIEAAGMANDVFTIRARPAVEEKKP